MKEDMFKDIFLNVKKVFAKVKFSFTLSCRYIVDKPFALCTVNVKSTS